MPPTARSSPPMIEPPRVDDLELDEIPSLDDIIPWSGPSRKPRQPPVFDAVRTVQDINVMFLQNVLKSYFAREKIMLDVRVESHTHAPMETPNHSQRNTLVEVNVEAIVHERKETYHMVIKTLTVSQPVRALSAVYFFDRREVGLYQEILDDINVFQQQQVSNPEEYIIVPSSKCFFARYTASSGEITSGQDYNIPSDESVIVLENVKYQGFTHTLIDEGLSKEQVMTVVEGVARLHGLSLAMKERSGIPLQRSYPYLLCMKEATQCIVKLFDKNIGDIDKMLTEFGAFDLRDKLNNIRLQLEDLIEALARPLEPMTVLAHMNLWAHNILFKEDRCVFVDWQMITTARPTFDMAFLLASSVKSSVRRVHTDLFLNHYYDNFATYSQRFGLDIEEDLEYSREHLRQDFRYSQLLALFFCIAKARDLIVSRDTETQFLEYLHDLDDQDLLEPEIVEVDADEYIYWMPRNPEKSNIIFRVRRRSSSDDDEPDHICGLFPVYELPED